MTQPAGIQQSFQMALGCDVQRATRIVFEIFNQIYLLAKRFKLAIDRD
jgi:hypothetical protein